MINNILWFCLGIIFSLIVLIIAAIIVATKDQKRKEIRQAQILAALNEVNKQEKKKPGRPKKVTEKGE